MKLLDKYFGDNCTRLCGIENLLFLSKQGANMVGV